MKKKYSWRVTLLGLALLSTLGLRAQQHPFELADLAKLTGLSDPQFSPDGKSIAVVTSTPDYTEDRYLTSLVLVSVPKGEQRVLLAGKSGLTQPRWSPDGQELAYLAKAGTGKEAGPQLFVQPLAGGEPRQLTHTKKAIQHYAWRPDGGALAFVTADEPTNAAGPVDKGYDAFEVGNNDLFLSAAPTASHIWLLPAAGGEPKRLTSGAWSLPVTIPPGAPSSPLSWSPDGKYLTFVQVPTPHSGNGNQRTVQVLNVADGTVHPLTTRKLLEGYPSFSPDGSQIAYWYPRQGNTMNINEIWVSPTAGGEGRNLTPTLDRDIFRTIWMPDGKSLLLGGLDGNRTSLWLQPLKGGAARKLNLGPVSPNWSFWVDAAVSRSGSIAFIGTDPGQPAELFYLASPTAAPRRLTDFNHAVKELQLGKAQTLTWQSDGVTNDGELTYPANYVAGKAYPLVLVIHGGPTAASTATFSSLSQLFAGRGYFVFEPNYRGSDNLGNAYKAAIYKDAGAGPGRDVMAGLAQLKRNGLVDTTRIGVSGWSYGGYMTVWLLGHYPATWKAAVAGAAVTDWFDQYNLGDSNVQRSAALGESPWLSELNAQNYRDQSPISMAGHIRTPTLILANTADPRVPITQSYKLFHALQDNGVTTKFIAWPVAAHNASDPVRQRERNRFWLDWMDTYLQPGGHAEAAHPGSN
ncbi:alpha/beta hydrolase family protein [Hymenobacter sp. BRD67]|uniref:S9 family peptidase n=1 Tax=Hymenobacter sp. BRD67 TaxID=2675877 RepID=UPI001566C4EE|nr:S9 family peptidase [Hymenobacter sp. BRD67]QKG52539.1 S9 family peptidase [Hymenobacter sp. BRD67]